MLPHVVLCFARVAAVVPFVCLGNSYNAASEPSAVIAVRVYRLAQVPASTLDGAEAEAEKIFQQAGIGISWFHCGHTDKSIKGQTMCSEPAGPARPVLRILSCFRPEPGVIAETVGFANISASIANISFDRVSELMPYITAPRSSVLGFVIAHEIGHLLIQTRGHSPLGIMHFPWSPKEMGLANHNLLIFTAEQARAMLAELGAQPPDTESSVGVGVSDPGVGGPPPADPRYPPSDPRNLDPGIGERLRSRSTTSSTKRRYPKE